MEKAAVVPPLTIGLPVYNGERHLAQCLDSLLAQDYDDFTLLISDNASTDGTREIAGRYVARDSRVRYVRQTTNIGLYGNLNFLLRSARSTYFKFANADDFWTPDMVGKAIACLEREPGAALCYPMMIMVDVEGRETGRYHERLELADANPARRFRRVLDELRLVNQLTGVMRTRIAQRTLPMPNEAGGDVVFLSELCLYGQVLQIPEFHYYRRFHERASSHARQSVEHQRRYVQPAGTGVLRWPHWRRHLGLLRRVWRSPLPTGSRLQLMGHLGRRMVWDRTSLCRELLGIRASGKTP